MLKSRFGIEIEFTGVTRRKASEIVAKFFNSTVVEEGTYYDTKSVKQADGRKWKIMYDGSIRCQKKVGGKIESADRLYSVELVSPILTYK